MNAGIGGALGGNGSNNNLPVSSGSTTTLWDCIVAHNQAIGGRGGAALGGGVASLTTVQGGQLQARMIGKSIVLTDAKGGRATVTQADVLQSNGVIHVTDSVSLPG